MRWIIYVQVFLFLLACSPNKKSGNTDVSFLPNGDTNMVIHYIQPNQLVYFVQYRNNIPSENFYSVPGMDSLTVATLYPFDNNEKFFVYYPIQTFKNGMELKLFTCDSSFSKPIKTLIQRKVNSGEVISFPKGLGYFKSVLSGTNTNGQNEVFEANH